MSCLTETPTNIEMSAINSSSTKPPYPGSYNNNGIHFHDEIASSRDQAVYDVIDDVLPGHNYDYVLPKQKEELEISDMSNASTEPVNHASYNNAIQLHDELTSSNQASAKRKVKDDTDAYEVPVDTPSSGPNDNYIEVIPCDQGNKEMITQTTELVDQASFSNKTQLHPGSESEEQAAYEVPVDMPSSGQNDTFHNVPPSKDEKYEKNTGDPRYQPLELSRQTIYQELYEKMA